MFTSYKSDVHDRGCGGAVPMQIVTDGVDSLSLHHIPHGRATSTSFAPGTPADLEVLLVDKYNMRVRSSKKFIPGGTVHPSCVVDHGLRSFLPAIPHRLLFDNVHAAPGFDDKRGAAELEPRCHLPVSLDFNPQFHQWNQCHRLGRQC